MKFNVLGMRLKNQLSFIGITLKLYRVVLINQIKDNKEIKGNREKMFISPHTKPYAVMK